MSLTLILFREFCALHISNHKASKFLAISPIMFPRLIISQCSGNQIPVKPHLSKNISSELMDTMWISGPPLILYTKILVCWDYPLPQKPKINFQSHHSPHIHELAFLYKELFLISEAILLIWKVVCAGKAGQIVLFIYKFLE